MYIAPDGGLGHGDPDARTFASHGETSVARLTAEGPSIRGSRPPRQATNAFLWALREDWAAHTTAERIDYVHHSLNTLRNPLDALSADVWGDLTLGEMEHARKVLTRLLPFLIGAANAESTGQRRGFTTVTPSDGPNL